MANPCQSAWQRKWLGLDVTAPPVQRMADEVEQFIKRWFLHDTCKSLLVLIGNSGTGKTHAARAIYKFARAASNTAYEKGHWGSTVPGSHWLSWPEVTDGFKNGCYSVTESAIETSLLVLDDVGAEHDPSRNAADKLCQILSRREFRFTVITTNIVPTAWSQRFDVRITDRLMRNSVLVDLSGITSYAVTQLINQEAA